MPHHSVLFKIIQGSPGAHDIYFRVPHWNIYRFKLFLQNGATASVLLRISSASQERNCKCFQWYFVAISILRWKRTNASWREVKKFKSRVQCVPSNSPRKHILTQRIIERELTRGFASHDGFRAPTFLAAIIAIHRTWNNTKMCNLF